MDKQTFTLFLWFLMISSVGFSQIPPQYRGDVNRALNGAMGQMQMMQMSRMNMWVKNEKNLNKKHIFEVISKDEYIDTIKFKIYMDTLSLRK
ncbi:hypothetical protein SAMN05216436_10653 [bacterium A37T11]|nr:hypothetical protein SAMN05216436_10653 [bacterium A37T11]